MTRFWLKTLPLAGILMTVSGTTCVYLPIPAPKDTDWSALTVDAGTATRPSAIEASDIDGDGNLDVIVGYTPTTGPAGPEAFVFFQTDPTDFTPVRAANGEQLAGVVALTAGDVDQDGIKDILAACNGRLVYAHNSGNVRSSDDWIASEIDASTDSGIGQWRSVVVADIDQQGARDVVAGCEGRVSWFIPPDDAVFGVGWTRVDIDATHRNGSNFLAVTDVDGDGLQDICSSAAGETEQSVVWYQHPADPTDASAWTRHFIGNLPSASRLVVGDLDRDGDLDVIVTNPFAHTVAWYVHPASPPADDWEGFVLAQYDSATPVGAAVADVDTNGQNDVIIGTRQPSTLRWFSPAGDQTRQWVENQIADRSDVTISTFVIGDINKDNHPDVIAALQGATESGDAIAWFKNPETGQ